MQNVIAMGENLSMVDGLSLDTREDLEPQSLNAFIETIVKPSLYPIGPIVRIVGAEKIVNKCLAWLTEQPFHSYLNMEELKLLGTWPSPFSYRVIWALKLKGIDYEYIPENLSRKSALLLEYNPVHKKIPVLVHGGKPIAESIVILEYIEEMWPEKPLLPKDPYKRSIARFWSKFADDKGSSMWKIIFYPDEREQAIKDSLEYLKTIEDLGLGETPFFGGDAIGLVDLVFGVIAHWLGAIEEIAGVKLLETNRFPRLHAWTENFKQVAVIKENLPDYDEMVVYLKHRVEVFQTSPWQ
ncbi:hypothetical protein IFM89_039455 [Coptis chinensis]|uniref:glutathione transferase n=1 Tax=Coptis chinensis TaxID=261450 RepID=A0A835I925_9MAGN|nr:hypothetical protein IFM89_039455 [Coptis chinensis]